MDMDSKALLRENTKFNELKEINLSVLDHIIKRNIIKIYKGISENETQRKIFLSKIH